MARIEKEKPAKGTTNSRGIPHGVDQELDTLRQTVWNNQELIRSWRQMEEESEVRLPKRPKGRRLG